MRRTIVALVPIFGLVALAACSTDQGTSPRSITSQQALASGGPPAPSCNFSNMTKAARTYLSSTDPVLDSINAMQSDYTKNGGAVAATPHGWDIFRLIAKERLTSSQGGSAASGATLVSQVFLCMADLTTSPTTIPMPVPSDFTTAGHDSLALSVGIFEVRSGNDLTGKDGAALAIYKSTPTSPRSATPPGWGVEATTTTAWPTGPFLVYSYPTNLTAVSFVSSATKIDGAYDGFEMGRIPASTPISGLLVGVCYSPVTGTTVANRLTHDNNQIFVNVQPDFCPATVASLNSTSFFLSMAQRAAKWLSPKPAYAQGGDSFLGIGGLPDGWSPFTAGALVGTSIQPSFDKQPVNVNAFALDSVIVHVTDNRVAVPGVAIALSIANNSGAPAGAVFIDGVSLGTTDSNGLTSTTTTPGGTTDKNGLVTIYFSVGKAGGYTVTAGGKLDVVQTSSATSKLFNIKNQ
jgi:hypothetical protein